MKLECYLDLIVIQVVMQLEVKQHCRCTCIVAAVGYCAERAKDGTPRISRMVTRGSRRWWFDGLSLLWHMDLVWFAWPQWSQIAPLMSQ